LIAENNRAKENEKKAALHIASKKLHRTGLTDTGHWVLYTDSFTGSPARQERIEIIVPGQ
jgi:hypothetical protein